jgi:hypothetical protein
MSLRALWSTYARHHNKDHDEEHLSGEDVMTYPPQQPGPGGWDQQAGTNAPAGVPQQQPQQQPGWYGNQHTGWDQQQQAQPGGQQPFPPPPDWGGAQYGQADWTHEPGGFGDIEAPKKKSKMPWILGIVGALVVVGGGAAAVFIFLLSGPGDPKAAAQNVVDKVNAHDFASVRSELCQANRGKLEGQISALEAFQKFDIKLGNITQNGEKATAQLTGTYSANGGTTPVDQQLVLAAEGGQWKLCGLGQ